VGERWVVSPAARERARAEVLEAIAATSVEGLDLALLDERHRAVLAQLDGVDVGGGRAWLAGQLQSR